MSDAAAPLLFEPITLRGLTLPNRIVISPMATYSADEGMPSTGILPISPDLRWAARA